jgi:maltose-binding protein MalE
MKIGETDADQQHNPSTDAVTHNKQIWAYPISLEAILLIHNTKFVTGKPPTQLSELLAFSKELREESEGDRDYVGLRHALF